MFKTKRLHKFIALFISVMFIFSPLVNVLPTVIFAEEGSEFGDGETPTTTAPPPEIDLVNLLTGSTETETGEVTNSSTVTSQTPSTAPPTTPPDVTPNVTTPTKSQEDLDREYINSLDSVEAITLWQSNRGYYYPLLTGDNKVAVDIYIDVNLFTDMAALEAFLNSKGEEKAYYQSFLTDDNIMLLEEYRASLVNKELYNAEWAIVETIAGYVSVNQLTADDLAFLDGNRTTALADYLEAMYGITNTMLASYADGKSIYAYVYKSNFNEGLIELIKASLFPNVRTMLDSYKAQYDLEMSVITYIFKNMTEKSEIEYYGKNADEARSNAVNRILYPDNTIQYGTLTYALADFLENENLTVYFSVYETGENIYNSLYKNEAPNQEVIFVLIRASLIPENMTALDTYMQTLADDEANYNAEMNVIEAIARIKTDEAYDAYYNNLSADVRAIVDRILSGNSITSALVDYLAENDLTCDLTDSNELYYFFKNYDEEYTAGQLILIKASLTDDQKVALEQGEDDNVYIPPSNYTNVAPLLPISAKLSQTTVRSMMARSSIKGLFTDTIPTIDPSTVNKSTDGLFTEKSVKANTDGTSEITLKAWTKGRVETRISSVPMDIILVIDLSDQMRLDMAGKNEVPETNEASRLYALKKALNEFVNTLGMEENGSLSHTITVIAPTPNSGTATTKLSSTNNLTTIRNFINGLTVAKDIGNGSTHYKAAECLTLANARINTQKEQQSTYAPVVIFFTAGYPRSSNTGGDKTAFHVGDANAAITQANYIKRNGATLYTVGITSDAAPELEIYATGTDDTLQTSESKKKKMNKFMHYMSSNFNLENADVSFPESMSSNRIDKDTEGYYLAPSETKSLTDVFHQIAERISEPTITLGNVAIVRDVLSDYFVLPNDFDKDRDVKVYTEEYSGENFTGDLKSYSGLTINVNNVNQTTIDVSGFNFDENYIIEEDDPQHSDNTYGRRLVITFNVKSHPDFLGGNNVPTNIENSSGLFYSKGSNTYEWLANFNLPTANVPLNYDVNLGDQHIYLSNKVESIAGDNFIYPGTLMEGTSSCNNAYVKISYQRYKVLVGGVLQEEGEPVTVDEKGTLTDADKKALFAPTPKDEITGNTQYVIKATLQAETPTECEVGEPQDKETFESKKSTIYVAKPTITWTDTSVDANTPVTLEGQITDIKWICSCTEDEDVECKLPAKSPDIIYTFTFDSELTVVDGKVSPTTETKVDVSVIKLDGKNGKIDDTDDGYMAHVKFKWVANTNTTEGVNCPKGEDCDGHPTEGNSPDYSHFGNEATHEFTIHIKSFTLIIKKEGATEGANESFIFEIKDDKGNLLFYEVIQENGEKEIKNLKSGKYTITESKDWSWRYGTPTITGGTTLGSDPYSVEIDSAKDVKIVEGIGTVEVTYTNKKTEHSWLSGDTSAVNRFTYDQNGDLQCKQVSDDSGSSRSGNTSNSSPSLMTSPTTVTAPPAALPFTSLPSLITIPNANAEAASDSSASAYSGVYARNVIPHRP